VKRLIVFIGKKVI
ncbi:MAG: hypothetical protein QG663_1713, partial [Thermodesulfobacteriota bacterium]|nr:hypothetical protein [Thermodesulfobacteriota bacterium]